MISRRGILGAVAASAAFECAVADARQVTGPLGLRVPSGHLVVVGYNMAVNKPDRDVVSWCDPHTGEWAAKTVNDAGWYASPYPLTGPASLDKDGRIFIPHKFGMWEMIYIGHPFVFQFLPKEISAQPVEQVS